MKSNTVIVFIFFINFQITLCSVFDIMDDAVLSVQEKFDNLFEDSGVTIDCTIFAVEQLVLSDNSYLERCQQQMENSEKMIQQDAESITDIGSEINTAYQESEVNNNNLNNMENIATVTKTDILKPKSNYDYPKKSDVLIKLESIQNSLQGETQNLKDIDSYLQQKLNKFSFDMNDNLDKTAALEKSSILEDIWSNLQVIHKKESNDKNSDPKIINIENMVNKIIEISNQNDTNETRIDNIINTIAKDITSGKPIISNIDSKMASMEALKNEISIENKLTTESPVAAIIDNSINKEIIRDKKEIVTNNIDTINKDTIIVSENNNPLPSITEAENLITPQTIQENKDIDLFSDYIKDFGTDLTNEATLPLARTSEARSIMKEYQHSEALINKYFNNPKYIIDDYPLTGQENDAFFNDDIFATPKN